MIRRQKTLLILDGIEPLQSPTFLEVAGALRDPGLAAVVRELARENNGLCVITSRVALSNIATVTIEVTSGPTNLAPTAVNIK